MEKKPTSGLAVTGLVLGIIAVFSAFVPLLNLLSFPFVLLAIIFGIIGLVQTMKGARSAGDCGDVQRRLLPGRFGGCRGRRERAGCRADAGICRGRL